MRFRAPFHEFDAFLGHFSILWVVSPGYTTHICNSGFTSNNKPTLDRKNNKIGHTKNNVQWCCNYCNSVKADGDEEYTKLFVQLKRFQTKYNLPNTLAKGDEEEYEVTRRNMTGGLSNIMPGPLKRVIKNEEEPIRIIKETKEIFSVDVKGHIDNRYLNEVVRFPPIFMNVDITTNKETVGESMYEYMTSNGMKVNKK
jgi:hypothetical protein